MVDDRLAGVWRNKSRRTHVVQRGNEIRRRGGSIKWVSETMATTRGKKIFGLYKMGNICPAAGPFPISKKSFCVWYTKGGSRGNQKLRPPLQQGEKERCRCWLSDLSPRKCVCSDVYLIALWPYKKLKPQQREICLSTLCSRVFRLGRQQQLAMFVE